MSLLLKLLDHLPQVAHSLTHALGHPLVQAGLQALAGWAAGQ